MRSVWNGLRNFWHFRRVIWRWRGWDFEYSYELFIRALGLQANATERYPNHVESETTVAQIRDAVAAWEEFKDDDMLRYDKFLGDVKAHIDDDQRCWELFHDICKEHGRGWWD